MFSVALLSISLSISLSTILWSPVTQCSATTSTVWWETWPGLRSPPPSLLPSLQMARSTCLTSLSTNTRVSACSLVSQDTSLSIPLSFSSFTLPQWTQWEVFGLFHQHVTNSKPFWPGYLAHCSWVVFWAKLSPVKVIWSYVPEATKLSTKLRTVSPVYTYTTYV